MPRPPRRPEQLRGRVFRGTSAVSRGLLTADELRGPAWRRVFRDVYACTTVDLTHEVLARSAAHFVVPGAVVSGRSAAVLWGLDLAGSEDDVQLTVPPERSRSRVPGIVVRRATLADEQVTRHAGVAVTTPVVTALETAARGPLVEAVVLLDRFVAERLVGLDALRVAAATATGRGCRQVRRAAALADGLAGSPQETRLRLLLHRSGLEVPVAQFTVRDDRGFVARVDFAWPDRRLAVEYDGLWHGDPTQFAADRRRLNRLTGAGWRVLFVTAEDLRRPARLLARIAAALAVRGPSGQLMGWCPRDAPDR
ncbi:endonuclease domain-containing protein [Geodermatophilus sp. SYSU D00804]